MRNAECGSGAPRFEGPGRSHQEGGELVRLVAEGSKAIGHRLALPDFLKPGSDNR